MVKIKPASTFEEAYNNLNPNEPLPGEKHPFYVPRPPLFNPGPLQEALKAANPGDKLLFSGHRGSGKSTELLRIYSQLEGQNPVIHINVETILDLGDIDYHDVLLALGEGLAREARKLKVRAASKSIKKMQSWYEEVFREQGRGIEAEISIGFPLLTARLRGGAEVRKTVREKVERRLSELLGLLNELIEKIQSKTKRPPVVLVDGLDKVYDLARAVKVFRDGAGALIAPTCIIVYTVPHVLLYDPTLGGVLMSFRGQYQLPNISPFNRDGTRHQEGWRALEEVLTRRVEEKLLPEETREKLIYLSGGVIRHLLTFAGEAVLRAMQQRHRTVTPEDVEEVEHRNRIILSPIFTRSQREILKQVASEHTYVNSEEARNLAMNLHILHYVVGREEWWDVHPLLKPMVKEW
ncbi:MAG: hypothetical protein RMK30_10730 [Anaerolineae bacterium]|nr:ATP-binding protein [Anaerolineae bacterium]MDW8103331.1 hypothetical protein [Anaerolineae bacterium]